MIFFVNWNVYNLQFKPFIKYKTLNRILFQRKKFIAKVEIGYIGYIFHIMMSMFVFTNYDDACHMYQICNYNFQNVNI